MAKIYGINTKIRGKVGEYIYRQTKVGTVVSEAPVKPITPRRSQQQMNIRTQWANLGAIYKQFDSMLRRGTTTAHVVLQRLHPGQPRGRQGLYHQADETQRRGHPCTLSNYAWFFAQHQHGQEQQQQAGQQRGPRLSLHLRNNHRGAVLAGCHRQQHIVSRGRSAHFLPW